MDVLVSIIAVYPELIALTLVVIVEWLLPISNKFTPAFTFHVLAKAISNKVAQSGSKNQQLLAGWLALFTYLFLIITILSSILFAVTNDIWTQAILLYFALGYQGVANQAKLLQNCITHKQRSAAKSLLANITEFDVNLLSELGLNKLTLESTTKHFVSFWLMPIILFLIFNGLTALMYRALMEAYRVWQPKTQPHLYFGQAVYKVKNTIEFLPTLIIAPIYSIFKSSPNWLGYIRINKLAWRSANVSSFNQLFWLSIVSAGCKSELAGPIMLNSVKLQRPRINHGAPLTSNAIGELISWNNRFRITFILFNVITITTLVLLHF